MHKRRKLKRNAINQIESKRKHESLWKNKTMKTTIQSKYQEAQ